ncbi:MAG TPA: protein kinase [Kofleriaceae bacterium]|nr:protein kinase [Kofleriaceae bacterium]
MELACLLEQRFEVEYQARAGGMGEVFRGRDRVSGQPVAIKVMSDSRDEDVRFTREVQLLAGLSHPGIVRYIAHGTTPSGAPFLVMEWLDGEDLRRRLEREPLTVGESVALATRVAEALGTAHARGIVHRDLKPSNLFLPDGRIDRVKILDFGIAHQTGRTRLTETGMMVGTPGYMAPEQARNHEIIDARVDVFALGCVLFQCVTGIPPFEGDSAIAVLGKILFDEAPRIRALWPEVPGDLDALVAWMLAKDPALRPSDGAHLAAALAALGPEAHSAVVPPRDRVAQRLTHTGSERRLLSVVLIAAAGEAPPAEGALQLAIRPYGGHLEQLADGPTIIAVEGGLTEARDQAAQAARCALAIRALVPDRAMAIAMGRAESISRLPDGEVIGHAARLLAPRPRPAAPADGPLPIALDEITAGLLDARFDVAEAASGLMLCGERALMQGARTLLGRPTSCVGRDWELSALTAILDECIDEREARAVIVTAAAGMGKSRLTAEFIARIQRRDAPVAVWVGRGDSLRAGSTLDLLAQALRSALGLHGGEPLAERHARIRARVAERMAEPERKRVAEFLGELVGAPFPADGEAGVALRAARQDAQLMSEQMRRVWLDFLGAESTVRPVLLVLEDLHWGDFGTVRFLDTALRDRSERPWMVLALARPEVFELFPRLWAERQNVQEIRLQELGRKAGERLVRQVLGDSVGLDTIERLVMQADGNAFYLEELIRAAAEGKHDALPDTVLAMVETRLGRLAFEARRVLRAASVFGEACWERGVDFLLGGVMSAALVGEWLTRLVEQEVLTVRPDSRFPGEQEFRFRHALLREGAHATLTEDDKRLSHQLAGDWLERHGEADPMVLAGHFELGGDGDRAAHHYKRAVEQAIRLLDQDAAMTRADLGLRCASTAELRIELLGMRCEASVYFAPLHPVVMPDAEELLGSAPRGSISWAQGVLSYVLGTMATGRIPDLLATVPLLHEVDPAPEAAGRMTLAYLGTVLCLDMLGQLPEATALADRFSAVLQATGNREPLARFWWHILVGMRATYAHDDPWDGLRNSDAIWPIFEVIGGENVFLNMQVFRGINRWLLGAFEPGRRIFEDIAAADTSIGPASSLRRFCLSWLLADTGALDQARAVATQLSEHGHAIRIPLEEYRGRWALGEVLRRIGDLESAERELAIALGMAAPLERPGVLATLSMLRLAQGRAGEALAAAEDAIARCVEMGGCGMFRGAFVRLAHAEALHATGAHDAARHAIAEARTRLLRIADRIPDPEYRQSFLHGVPENARTLALAGSWLGEPVSDT